MHADMHALSSAVVRQAPQSQSPQQCPQKQQGQQYQHCHRQQQQICRARLAALALLLLLLLVQRAPSASAHAHHHHSFGGHAPGLAGRQLMQSGQNVTAVGNVRVSRCGAEHPSVATADQLQSIIQRPAVNARVAVALATSATYVIKVHLHVINNGAGLANGNITDAMVTAQMAALNAGYASTPFSFVLASVDYTTNPTWYHMTAGSAEMLAAKKALHKGSWREVNIYFISFPGTIYNKVLGSSVFPWDAQLTGISNDGVTVDWETLPGDTSGLTIDQYNLGYTVVHEVGHWFGLFHPFYPWDVGYGTVAGQFGAPTTDFNDNWDGCMSPGDYVDDTPAVYASPYYIPDPIDDPNGALGDFTGCSPVDSCPSQAGSDPIHNFMGYYADTCMNDFSAGQTARMLQVWHAFRYDVAQPPEPPSPPAPPPSPPNPPSPPPPPPKPPLPPSPPPPKADPARHEPVPSSQCLQRVDSTPAVCLWPVSDSAYCWKSISSAASTFISVRDACKSNALTKKAYAGCITKGGLTCVYTKATDTLCVTASRTGSSRGVASVNFMVTDAKGKTIRMAREVTVPYPGPSSGQKCLKPMVTIPVAGCVKRYGSTLPICLREAGPDRYHCWSGVSKTGVNAFLTLQDTCRVGAPSMKKAFKSCFMKGPAKDGSPRGQNCRYDKRADQLCIRAIPAHNAPQVYTVFFTVTDAKKKSHLVAQKVVVPSGGEPAGSTMQVCVQANKTLKNIPHPR